ncbi:hypothetical protein ACWENQ_45595 [Nonomuraea sp. NPDC004354]
MNELRSWAEANPALAIAGAVVCLALAAFVVVGLVRLTRAAVRTAVRLGRKVLGGKPAEDVLTYVAAGIATGVAATGMWEFFANEFPELVWPLRVLFFAFIEVAVITSAIRARRSMRENFKPGLDGIAVWGFTCLSAVLAAIEAPTFQAKVLRFAAPIAAAWLWERGMAIERARLTGRSRIAWKVTPERLLVKLGLADPTDRDASEVAVHRYITRVALAANALRELPAAPAGGSKDPQARARSRALKRLHKARDEAVEYAQLGNDPDVLDKLMGQLRLIYNTPALATVELSPPWELVDAIEAVEVEQIQPDPTPDPDPHGGGRPPAEPHAWLPGPALPGAVVVPETAPGRVNGYRVPASALTPTTDVTPSPGIIDPLVIPPVTPDAPRSDTGDPSAVSRDPERGGHDSSSDPGAELRALPSDAARVRAAIKMLGNDPAGITGSEIVTLLGDHGVILTNNQVKNELRRARERARQAAEIIDLPSRKSRGIT